MAARWTKLKSGEFGVNVDIPSEDEPPAEGELVEVTSKSGKITTVRIAKVLWTGIGKFSGEPQALCEITKATKEDIGGSPF